MTKRERAALVISLLEQRYPESVCSLEYTTPLHLLIATRLSAQCTDARVNMVTPALFAAFPDVDAFCASSPEEIGEYVKSCGLFNTKARDIHAMCIKLRDDFGGEVPSTMEELLSLPGVGRKTANLILGDIWKKPAVVADTHCIRISGRLGLTDSKDALKVELALRELLPPEKSNDLCHRFVLFGRDTCTARSPKCAGCVLSGLCPSAQS